MPLERIIENSQAIDSDRLRAMYDYWRAKAGRRLGPRRREILPEEIKTLLPWIWLADVVDGGADYRFRLGGEEIIRFVGRRLAGGLLSAHDHAPFFQNMRARFDACVRARGPLLVGPMRSAHQPRDYMNLTVLLLPSSENGADVTMLFGAVEIAPAFAPAFAADESESLSSPSLLPT